MGEVKMFAQISGASAKCCHHHLEGNLEKSIKITYAHVPLDPAILVLGIYFQNILAHVQMPALFIEQKFGNNPMSAQKRFKCNKKVKYSISK